MGEAKKAENRVMLSTHPHVKLSQLPLRRIRSNGAVLCDGAGRGVERTGKGEGGGCVGDRGSVVPTHPNLVFHKVPIGD